MGLFNRRAVRLLLGSVAVVGASDCGREAAGCPRCGTVVIAATGDPSNLLPPLAVETVARDIGDQVYERLADLAPGAAPIDSGAYRPALASRWERVDSLTWRFHLRPEARWQDGRPVTAEDVRFSCEAFGDSVLDPPARPYIAHRVTVVPEDSATLLIRFAEPSPEQLCDATYHVRVIPSHIWSGRPKESWAGDTAVADLVGSGPYRVAEWRRGEYVRLVADSSAASPPAVRQAVWRFAPDPDAALNLVLSHEADLLETVGSPERAARVARDSALRLVLWIWNDSIRTLPFDTVQANRALDAAGWRRPDSTQPRRRGSRALAFDILVPSTSPVRRQLAVALQAMWQSVGAAVTVTAVDFSVFQERLGQGKFDSYIGAWLDEPSPRGLAEQWTRAGWAELNYGHYANPAFESLFARASRARGVDEARGLYRQAMDTLNADAPALFLYAPANIAVISQRVEGVEIAPYSWASGLRRWSAGPPLSGAKPGT